MAFSPFRDGDSHPTFRNFREKTISEIQSLDNEYVLKCSRTELEDYLFDKVIFEIPTLDKGEYYIEHRVGVNLDVSNDVRRAIFPGERVSVPGTALVIAIPFSGDPSLLRIRPSTLSWGGYPEIEVREGAITIAIKFADDDANPKRLKSEIDRKVDSLASAVEHLAADVQQHNDRARQEITAALDRKLKQAKDALSTVSELGIPMRRRTEQPSYSVPARRRRLPKPPSVPKGKYEPEPTLAIEEYEHILTVLRSMSLVMERSPSAFSELDEEAIRTHFLLQLNGHYDGGATGETFNASGKTDILIRAEGRNVFIAECKFWRGSKGYSDAIDQLLSYLTWRDSKAALLVFNKQKGSDAVRTKMHEVMMKRQEHRKMISHDPVGDSRYILVKADEPGREIVVTTMLFEIPPHDP